MTTPTLTLINNCLSGNFLIVPNSGPAFLTTLAAGDTDVFSLDSGATFVSVISQTTFQGLGVALNPNATLTYQPGAAPGSCVLGDGPIPIQITNSCSGDATAFVQELDLTTGDQVSLTSLFVPMGATVLFYVRSDTDVFVSSFGNVLGPLRPGTNPAARFLTLIGTGAGCAPTLTPGTGTITITNRCRFDAVVTVRDVASGTVLPGAGTFVIPAGVSVTYTFQSIATTLAQVCLGGRCVTVAEGGLVSLVDSTGFCAPIVGDPAICAVAPRCH